MHARRASLWQDVKGYRCQPSYEALLAFSQGWWYLPWDSGSRKAEKWMDLGSIDNLEEELTGRVKGRQGVVGEGKSGFEVDSLISGTTEV